MKQQPGESKRYRSHLTIRRKSNQRTGTRLNLESLESRLVPAVFNINSTADILNPTAGVVTLRSAIEMANSTPGDNTINFTVAGTYSITLSGAGEDNNATGDFDLLPNPASPTGSNLLIQNTSGGTVIVDGGQLDRVFDINPGNITDPAAKLIVTLQGFTVQNGMATDSASPDGVTSAGGGIRQQGNTDLTLTDMVVTHNMATADGGGIIMAHAFGTLWTLTINSSTISDNHAGGAGGGIDTQGGGNVFLNTGTVITGNTDLNQGAGIYIDAIQDGTFFLGANLTMTGTLVGNNQALGNGITASGGGISNAGSGTMIIELSTIENNSAGGMGGGFSDENNVGNLFVFNCILRNNSAVLDGGAIQKGGPFAQINSTLFTGNSSGGTGGALFANGTMLLVHGDTLTNNTSKGDGGAIELQTTGTDTSGSSISDSTFVDNKATSTDVANGGAIDAPTGFTGSMVLSNDTINGNSATNGGGIYWAGAGSSTFTLQNTIVATNTSALDGPDASNASGAFVDSGGNLIGISGAGSGNTGFDNNTTQTGTLAAPLDPLLGPLQNNGGPTIGAPGSTMTLPTEALRPGSPAMSTGIVNPDLPFDERGFPSQVSGKVNIGAVSNQGVFAVGEDSTGSEVKVYDGASASQVGSFLAFDPSFIGGVSVAVGDVNGDGTLDIIVSSGPGIAPEVKVIDGTKLSQVQSNGEIASAALLADFFAYAPLFLGGVDVAYAQSAAGNPEIVTGAEAGGGPHVKVIDGTKLSQVQSNGEIADSALLAGFYAYDPNFMGGVNVAAGDINADGVVDIITGAGPGGGPHVKVIDGNMLREVQSNGEIADNALLAGFYAYDPGFAGGVSVAFGKTSSGLAGIATGAGAGGGPHVKVFDGTKLDQVQANGEIADSALYGQFYAYDPSFKGGVSVGGLDINGDDAPDIFLGPGPGAAQPVKVVNFFSQAQVQSNAEIADSALLDNFFAFGSTFSGGVTVGNRV